ncbi:hypothetical protein LXL04_016477 [Taraxacum kok-saghyz]
MFSLFGEFAAGKLLWWSAKKSEKPAKSRRSHRRGPAARLCRWSPPYRDVRQRQTHQIRIPLAQSRSFENSYIPENPKIPKPLTFSKKRLRWAKNRSNISPALDNLGNI